MTYNFIFEPEYSRLLFACIVDNRASIPAIKNKDGATIKQYVDEQISLIDDNTLSYRIETNLGVIGGVFCVQVNTENKTGNLLMKQVRPAFQNDSELSEQIINFITNKSFLPDILL